MNTKKRRQAGHLAAHFETSAGGDSISCCHCTTTTRRASSWFAELRRLHAQAVRLGHKRIERAIARLLVKAGVK